MKRVAFIGFGAMARKVRQILQSPDTPDFLIVGILEVPSQIKKLQQTLGKDLAVVETLEDLLKLKPDIIAECATQSAVRQFGAAVLRAGVDLVIISIGALADESLLLSLKSASEEGNSRLIIPAGALGAIDALSAARLGGLAEVRQTLSKPPRSWRGTPAEDTLDLDSLQEKAVVFKGSARDAVTRYPQNANVAAAVALAGVGFENSKVTLMADPDLSGPVHYVEAEGAFGSFSLKLKGVSLPDNPKSSMLAALSVARALVNTASTIII